MNIRKGMAALLAVAMILTSQSFTSLVYASEVTDNTQAVTVASEEAEVAEATEVNEASPKDDKEEATVVTKDATDAEIGEDAEPVVSEEDADDKASESETTAEDSDDGESGEEAATVSDESSDTESPEDELNTEDEDASDIETDAEADSVEEELDDILIDDEDSVEASSDYFYVDTYGVLKQKSGTSLGKAVNIPSNAKIIPADIFKGDQTVQEVAFDEGSELVEIAPEAFKGSIIRKITIPKGVTEIKEGTFQNSALTELAFEDESQIVRVGKNAFKECNIKTITLSKCTEVGESAFENCTELYVVQMKTLWKIGESAFAGCSKLGDGFTFFDSIEYIGDFAFKGCGFQKVDITKLTALESTSSPSGTQNPGASLGKGVFQDNVLLTEAFIAATESVKITYIPDNMFSGCVKLNKISIPKYALTIGTKAFAGCSALTSIDLKEVQCVKTKAFEGCSKLREIILRYKDETDTNHVSIVKDSFPDVASPTVVVTMKGYDSEVEKYAAERGYKFVSLDVKYTVEMSNDNSIAWILGNNEVLTKDTRKPGNVVTILVYSKSGYVLKDINYMGEKSSEEGKIDFYGTNSSGDYVFKFVMPEENVKVYTTGVPNASVSTKTPEIDFDIEYNAEHDGVSPTGKNSNYKWDTRGLRTKFLLRVDGKTYGNWMYSFTSSDPNIVSVDSEGVIVGVSNGSAKITIVPRYNTKVKYEVNINVGGAINIGQINAGANNLAAAKKFIKTSNQARISIDEITKYPVVTFSKNLVAAGAQTIDVDIEAYRWVNDNHEVANYNTSVNYMVESDWSSVDTTIATVPAKSINNHNTINVVKGSCGEALITISTKNRGETRANQFSEDSDKWVEDNIAHIIVRVVDITPRLAESEIVVNHQLKYGTPISIIPVYGYEMGDDGEFPLYIAKMKKVNGEPVYYEDKDTKLFTIRQYTTPAYSGIHQYKDGFWYITTPEEGIPLAVGKDQMVFDNKLYICGSYKDTKEAEFAIPITKLTLINQQLEPKVTQTGSINLFYNNTADNGTGTITGKVNITQSLSSYEIDEYKLVSVENSKNEELKGEVMQFDPFDDSMDVDGVKVPFDSLGYNFDIKADPTSVNNSKAIITRSRWHNNLAVVGGKNVTGGYLYIYYTEYRDPVKVPLTVKTTYTAPSYKLSQTTVTAYANETGQVYPLYLYPSNMANTYANAVSLAKTYIVNGSGTIDDDDRFLRYDGLNTNIYTKLDVEELYKLTDKNLDGSNFKGLKHDYIRVKIADDVSASGKAVIAVHMTTWSDENKYLYYTFNIKAVDKLTAKFNPAKVTLNKAWTGGTDIQEIPVVPSTDDAEITEISKMSYTYSAKNLKQALGYETLAKLLSNGSAAVTAGKITLKQPKDAGEADAIPTGSYTFTCTPTATLKNAGRDISLAPIKLTISVVDKDPTITAGPLTLNSNAKHEKAFATLKYGNLIGTTNMSGYTVYDMDDTSMTPDPRLTGLDVLFTKSKTVYYPGIKADESNKTKSFQYIVADPYCYDSTNGLIWAKIGKNFDKTTAGSYTVTGVKMVSPGGSVADVAKYKLNFKLSTKAPQVTVSAKGNINMALPASEVVYAATVKNVVSDITKVKVYDIDSSNNAVSSRFYAYLDPLYPNTVFLRQRTGWDGTAKSGWNREEMVPNKTYKLMLCFRLGAVSGYPAPDITTAQKADASVIVTVKPINKYPTIKVKSTRTYAYAGQNRTDEYGFGTELTNNQWDMVVTAQIEDAYKGTVKLYDTDANNDYTGWRYANKIDISGIDWKGTLKKSIKDEFDIVPGTFAYNPVTGTIKFAVRLRNASEQIQDATYNLQFVPMVRELQIKKPTEGTTFGINVDVRK